MTGRWLILDRTAQGSALLLRRFGTWLSATGLEGKERTKTAAQRAGATFVLGWFAGGLVVAEHALMWALVAWWTIGTLVATHTPQQPPAAAPAPAAKPKPAEDRERAELARADFLYALAKVTEGRTGIHLWPLWEQVRHGYPAYAELSEKDLRGLLDRYGVPVHKITADGVRGRTGVRRADIEALMAPAPPPPVPAPSQGEEDRPDLRKSSSSPQAGEGPEVDTWDVHELGDDTLAMLRAEVSDR